VRRRLLDLLTLLSLLLCVAVAALWGLTASNGQSDGWLWSRTGPPGGDAYPVVRLRAWSLTVGDGVVEFTRVSMYTSPQTAEPFPDGASRTRWMIYRHLGVGLHRLAGGNFTARVPAWWVVALTAVMPAVWYAGRCREHRARVRRRDGLCPACGYDLRATPGRCPECGELMPAVAKE
jgi:hypothetical protein